jgi:hypothetical protein
MNTRDSDQAEPHVNPGYAVFQLAKALTTNQQHEDPATRQRAMGKVEKWTAVFNGIVNGSIEAGSRVPLDGVPAWATLEVVTGGFATGELLAGGPLLGHERELLSELPAAANEDARRVLNAHHLTDDGLASLQSHLQSGRYDVTLPEEGALLVVAWLVQNGFADEARSLLDELGPFLSRLRFYPVPSERAHQSGARVCLQTVGKTARDLSAITPNSRVLAQREAIQVWAPLYDQMARLFLETVQGEPPSLRCDENGNWARTEQGGFPVQGGWPCQVYPDGWNGRATELLNRCEEERTRHNLCGRPDRDKDSFAQLRGYLRRCVGNPAELNGREVGRIRLILARYVTKRGTPDSDACKSLRERQSVQANAPTFHEIAGVVIPRLESHLKDAGLENVDSVLQPVTQTEAEQWKIGEGTTVPPSLRRKVQRCLSDTVEVLVDRGIVTSGDTLAVVFPQLTSGIRAAGISDPTLRQLYGAIYRAFRQRRSLLLLNLESQVRIEELPWVAAIERFRRDDLPAHDLARQTLEEVTILNIVSFPQAIVPNKLLQEMRALAKSANITLPLVDEVAADIFMGEFSGKFLRAAKRAAKLLEGSLYETYYGIDYGQLRGFPEVKKPKRNWFSRPNIDPFGALCAARAGVTYGGWDPAISGMIIEQQQILTTQNLAVLFESLELVEAVKYRLEDLAQRCFKWVCRRQQQTSADWHARLISVKNTAYAWRQMVFFLALLPNETVEDFLAWVDAHLSEQRTGFQNRFSPALHGLRLAAEGRPVDAEPGARRFLGWSKKRHWLLD